MSRSKSSTEDKAKKERRAAKKRKKEMMNSCIVEFKPSDMMKKVDLSIPQVEGEQVIFNSKKKKIKFTEEGMAIDNRLESSGTVIDHDEIRETRQREKDSKRLLKLMDRRLDFINGLWTTSPSNCIEEPEIELFSQ